MAKRVETKELTEVSEAQIAVHWKEEEYYQPSEKFKAQAYLRDRSEEHTSELQSRPHLVCRLLLEKKKTKHNSNKCMYNTISIMSLLSQRCNDKPILSIA